MCPTAPPSGSVFSRLGGVELFMNTLFDSESTPEESTCSPPPSAFVENKSTGRTDWSEVLDRLNIELLWELPEQRSLVWPLGRPRCFVLDGYVAVGIELVYGARRHQVTYINPGTCCPWPECQLVVRASKAMPREIDPRATLKGSPNVPLEDDGEAAPQLGR